MDLLHTFVYKAAGVAFATPLSQLYEETLPIKGIKFRDNIAMSHSCVSGTQPEIYFICEDSNTHQRVDTMYSLNHIFNKFELVTDEIFTSIS